MVHKMHWTPNEGYAQTVVNHTLDINVIHADNPMKQVTKHEEKLAQEAVDRFHEWDALGKNTKYLEDGKTIQIRIWDALRVQFTIDDNGSKEIVDVFKKPNHTSHR